MAEVSGASDGNDGVEESDVADGKVVVGASKGCDRSCSKVCVASAADKSAARKLMMAMIKVLTLPSKRVKVIARGSSAHFVTLWESTLPNTWLPHTQTVPKVLRSEHVWCIRQMKNIGSRWAKNQHLPTVKNGSTSVGLKIAMPLSAECLNIYEELIRSQTQGAVCGQKIISATLREQASQ